MKPRVYVHIWSGRDEQTCQRSNEVAASLMRTLNESELERYAVLRPIRNEWASEIPTLAWIHYECQNIDPTTPVLYLHTKGASWIHGKAETPFVDDWRRLMLYFCVERWRDAVESLVLFKAVGCNVSIAHKPHFSGNFWWANAGALAALPKPQYAWERIEGEFWIGGVGLENMGSLHQSNVDHYFQPYPRNLYVTSECPA